MNVKPLLFLLALSPIASAECVKQDQATIEAMIIDASAKHGMDPDLIWSVAHTESKFDNCIVSKAGAVGVMQLMPKTAIELGVTDSYDAQQNIDGGVRYLLKQAARFKVPQFYLSAYNAGPHRVMKKRGVPNIKETKKYVRLVLKQYLLRRGEKNVTNALRNLHWH